MKYNAEKNRTSRIADFLAQDEPPVPTEEGTGQLIPTIQPTHEKRSKRKRK